MTDPFHVRVAVRGYELDVNGHLNRAHYLHYAEHARWECLRAAGLPYGSGSSSPAPATARWPPR
jgi:acyl-CoA thioester hydrolase